MIDEYARPKIRTFSKFFPARKHVGNRLLGHKYLEQQKEEIMRSFKQFLTEDKKMDESAFLKWLFPKKDKLKTAPWAKPQEEPPAEPVAKEEENK